MKDNIKRDFEKEPIDPNEEIVPCNIEYLKIREYSNHGICPRCRNNLKKYPSTAWTKTEVCSACESFVVTFYGDYHGGGYDITYLYSKKWHPFA